ncbi:N-acetyltransferase [Jeotgalibacillus sp. R-1-5s-1]|uniref:GNAT family N-acetyltransferase n=1 Tax=Jeotgalibacillus sp. R-1-5s-1 TaxID=2555897 RepID=UPI00106A3B08|nr:GNAT family N-acetyltransferase [Jeotgalibacillus sp. R-1-5s-1]TFE00800.1 GNAT family N-acetyltransferase [Jeotgalibacillus sp. R-1-5s-1]
MNIERLHSISPDAMDLLLLADPSEEVIHSYVHRGFCYAAYLNESLTGIYVLLPTRPQTIELVNIAVDDKCQGQGIGKKLVLHAIEESRKLHYHTIEIGTGNSSLPQLGLYQKCGFRITGIDHDFFTRHYSEPIFENGIQCRDMIRLSMDL